MSYFTRSHTGTSIDSFASKSSTSLMHFQGIDVLPVLSITPSNPSAPAHTNVWSSCVYTLGHPLQRSPRRRPSYMPEAPSQSSSTATVEAEECDFIDWTSTNMALNSRSHHLDLLREETSTSTASTTSTSSRRSLTGSLKSFASRTAARIVKRN